MEDATKELDEESVARGIAQMEMLMTSEEMGQGCATMGSVDRTEKVRCLGVLQ